MDNQKKQQFRQLPTRAQEAVLVLLRCAALDPDGHVIHAGPSGVKSRPYGLRVVLSANRPVCPVVTEELNLGRWLIDKGFVMPDEGGWESFRFRPEVLAWYRETHPPTDAEVREAVGRHFYELGTGDDALVAFDAAAVASKLGLPQERVLAAVRGLAGAGLLRNAGPRGTRMADFYQLTERGFQWAMSDFRSDLGLAPSVEVTVRVEIQQVIDVIASLPVSEEEKKAYELTALRLERELQKKAPAWGVIKEALEMAANAKEVAVPLVTLLAEHKDKILHAVQQAPIL